MPGTVTQFRWRKWDDGVHWVHDCVYLGHDSWGEWFGQPAGWRSIRPGRNVVTAGPNVTLMPPSGEYAMTVNAAPSRTRIYIDLGWDIGWSQSAPIQPLWQVHEPDSVSQLTPFSHLQLSLQSSPY